MRLAIETDKDTAETSFYGDPESDVESALNEIDSTETSTAYVGTSVEEYLSWSEMTQ
jgi:hypothetical protein